MAWRAITEADVLTVLSAEEIEDNSALVTSSSATAASSIRTAISQSQMYVMGVVGTIPSELVSDACIIIEYLVTGRSSSEYTTVQAKLSQITAGTYQLTEENVFENTATVSINEGSSTVSINQGVATWT